MFHKLDSQTWAKLFLVCSQSFSGLLHSGIFYSWGALVDAINISLNPNYNHGFAEDHGIFVGILILFSTVAYMLPVRLLIDSKIVSEFTIQLTGMILGSFGFFMGAVAVHYKLIWLMYIGCGLPAGVGGLLVYQRLIFNHQFFFKSIELHNLGSGVFGFAIGMWTVIFFLISVPLLDHIGITYVMIFYGVLFGLSAAYPVFTIDDEANKKLLEHSTLHRSPSSLMMSSMVVKDGQMRYESSVYFHSKLSDNHLPSHPSHTYQSQQQQQQQSLSTSEHKQHNIDDNLYTLHERPGDEMKYTDKQILNCTTNTHGDTDDIESRDKYKHDLNDTWNEGKTHISSDICIISDTTTTPNADIKSLHSTQYTQTSILIESRESNNDNKASNKNIRNQSQRTSQHESSYTHKNTEDSEAGITCTPSEYNLTHQASHTLEDDDELDDNGHYGLTYTDILLIPQTYILIIFFICVITPGWGIKLASYSILQSLFKIDTATASQASALYVTFYALGRLVSGLMAEYIGVFRTYDIMIITSLCLLILMPFSAEYLPHGASNTSGYSTFITLLCLVGLMYGGAIALFYSIIFDIFGPRNYRNVFAVTAVGFAGAVVVGGISSSYSFNSHQTHTIHTANTWFFVMASSCLLGLILLHGLYPYDYSLDKRPQRRKKKIATVKQQS